MLVYQRLSKSWGNATSGFAMVLPSPMPSPPWAPCGKVETGHGCGPFYGAVLKDLKQWENMAWELVDQTLSNIFESFWIIILVVLMFDSNSWGQYLCVCFDDIATARCLVLSPDLWCCVAALRNTSGYDYLIPSVFRTASREKISQMS